MQTLQTRYHIALLESRNTRFVDESLQHPHRGAGAAVRGSRVTAAETLATKAVPHAMPRDPIFSAVEQLVTVRHGSKARGLLWWATGSLAVSLHRRRTPVR